MVPFYVLESVSSSVSVDFRVSFAQALSVFFQKHSRSVHCVGFRWRPHIATSEQRAECQSYRISNKRG